MLFLALSAWAQTTVFSENHRWGIKEKSTILVAPIYDSVFNFDESGKVCMVCFKLKTAAPANKIIRVNNSYKIYCNYLDRSGKKLNIKTDDQDTCTVFSLGKSSFKQYTEYTNSFVVAVKGKKYMVGKDFKQITFKGYHDVSPSVDPGFYNVQVMDENEVVLAGLIDRNESFVIPAAYSHIKINPADSLIIACTAGVRTGADDDVFNYEGKKRDSYRRHVEMATKNFVIEKIFEPKEHFVIVNLRTKEEKNLQANEVYFYEQDEILIRIKDDWYVYDLKTDQKKPKQY